MEDNKKKRTRENLLTQIQKAPKHEKPQKAKYTNKEFRELQKEISKLPAPAFNNPEKIQPVKEVEVPTAIITDKRTDLGYASENKKHPVFLHDAIFQF